MTRIWCALALALVVCLPGGLAISGCCSCSEGDLDPGPKRPGDVVRDLRDAIGQHDWVAASACFTDEARARYGEVMTSGRFFQVRAHRDDLASGGKCRCLPGGAGEPEEVVVDYPLGPGDVVLAVVAHGDTAEVTIAPLHPAHGGPGSPPSIESSSSEPRPETLSLLKTSDGWKVAAPQPKLRAGYGGDASLPGCAPEGK